MVESSNLRMTRIPLNHGAGQLPALGFGTLIPDAARDDNRDQRRTGSRIPTLRLRGTIRERTRGWHGVAGRTCRWRDRARKHFCYHKAGFSFHKADKHESETAARAVHTRGTNPYGSWQALGRVGSRRCKRGNTKFTMTMPFVIIPSQASESLGGAICRPCGVIIRQSHPAST